MGFWIFMLVMTLLIPLTMVGLGTVFIKRPPRDVNYIYGYRTTRSMKNKDTWEFAHHYCGKLWRVLGWIILLPSIIAILFSIGRTNDEIGVYGLVIVAVQMIALFTPIFPVESALNKVYDENGRRRK
jgi:uncharacterized membrane protein